MWSSNGECFHLEVIFESQAYILQQNEYVYNSNI